MLEWSQSASYDGVPGGHDLSAPFTSLKLGLHPRLEFSADVGMVRSRFEDTQINGLADSELGVKIVVFPESDLRPALAFKPTLEILGAATLTGSPLAPGRFNCVLPVVVQKSFDRSRWYYSAGYVSRGFAFHSLTMELNQWRKVIPVAIVSASRATRQQDRLRELGLNRSRADALVGVTVIASPNWSLFTDAGRSVGRSDANSTRYQVTAGVTYRWRLWGKR